MESVFRALQLSDIHFGDRFYLFDWVANSDPNKWAIQCAEEIERALNMTSVWDPARENDGIEQFDCLVVSGDFTCFGQSSGRTALDAFVKGFQNSRWRARGVLLLPGNHDITFGPPPSREQVEGGQYVPPTKDERERFYRETYAEVMGEQLAPSWLGVLKPDPAKRLAILGLDSCRVENWADPGLGFVGYDQLFTMSNKLFEDYEASSPEPWRRVVFLHHHLLAMGDVDVPGAINLQQRHRLTLTLDAPEILRGMTEYRVPFAAHGHFHVPNLATIEPVLGQGTVLVAACGSCGVQGTECVETHHFYLHEFIDADENPRLVTRGFTCDVQDPVRNWQPTSPWERPLERREALSYARDQAVQQKREARARTAASFLFAYESLPLALACLQDRAIIPAPVQIELYNRLSVPWFRLGAHIDLLELWSDILRHMQANRAELRKTFREQLNSTHPVSFEHFLLSRLLRLPQFARAVNL